MKANKKTASVSALATQSIVMDSIVESGLNPNSMGKDAYRQLVANIRLKGFLQAILVRLVKPETGGSYYQLIDGAHRIKAMKEIGETNIPAMILECSEPEAIALRIAMNRLRGQVDLGIAKQQLEDLLKTHLWTADQVEITGFSAQEIADLIQPVLPDPEPNNSILTSPDDTGDAPATELSDVSFTLEVGGFESKSALNTIRKKLVSLSTVSPKPTLASALRYLIDNANPSIFPIKKKSSKPKFLYQVWGRDNANQPELIQTYKNKKQADEEAALVGGTVTEVLDD